MAATITKGYTFSATEWVTAGKLHTLVDGATISGIVNSEISTAAAITYSKLSLSNSILNADINASADLSLTKIASGASGTIPITNSAGELALQLISGDITIDASGVGGISAGVILNADINASADIALSKLVSAASASTLFTNAAGEFAAVAITGDISIGSDGTSTAVSATSTSKGISELAIASEVNTGTDTGRVITPDALAGSNLGRKIIELVPFERTSSIASGDGKADLVIPPALNGMDLVYINGAVLTAGSSGATTLMLYNVTDGVDMLTTAVSIPSGTTGFGVSGGLNATGKSVATGDWLRLDLDSVCTTAEKGLLVTLEFSLP